MAGFGDTLAQIYLQAQQQRFAEALQAADQLLRTQSMAEQLRDSDEDRMLKKWAEQATIDQNRANAELAREVQQYKIEQDKLEYQERERARQEQRDKEQKARRQQIFGATIDASKHLPNLGAAAKAASFQYNATPAEQQELLSALASGLPAPASKPYVSGFSPYQMLMRSAQPPSDEEILLGTPTVGYAAQQALIDQRNAQAAYSQARAKDVETTKRTLDLARADMERARARMYEVKPKVDYMQLQQRAREQSSRLAIAATNARTSSMRLDLSVLTNETKMQLKNIDDQLSMNNKQALALATRIRSLQGTISRADSQIRDYAELSGSATTQQDFDLQVAQAGLKGTISGAQAELKLAQSDLSKLESQSQELRAVKNQIINNYSHLVQTVRGTAKPTPAPVPAPAITPPRAPAPSRKAPTVGKTPSASKAQPRSLTPAQQQRLNHILQDVRSAFSTSGHAQ